jgi:hypothetical protein
MSLRTLLACFREIDATEVISIGSNFERTVERRRMIVPKTSYSQRGQAEYIAANAAPLSLMMREFNPPWRRTHLRT